MKSLAAIAGLGGLLATSALAQSPDKLIVPDGSAPAGESLLLPMSLAGPSPVVAMQFDIRFTKSIVDVLGPIAAGDSNHRVMSREVLEGLRRVVVFSRSNATLPKDVVIDLPMVMAVTEDQPSPMLRIEGLCFALANGTKITPQIERGPLDAWFAGHFTPAELQVPSIYGDRSDPDGDGLPNLMEFALGGSPWLFDSSLRPQLDLLFGTGGEPWISMAWWKSRDAAAVTLEPQVSDNLFDWTTVAAHPTGAETTSAIEWEVIIDRTGHSKLFMRLSVRRAN
jgi:hypothetical protein